MRTAAEVGHHVKSGLAEQVKGMGVVVKEREAMGSPLLKGRGSAKRKKGFLRSLRIHASALSLDEKAIVGFFQD
eukprot:scaffold1981_cov345-Pinguiococcus_pyrenoidosus.AAC.17